MGSGILKFQPERKKRRLDDSLFRTNALALLLIDRGAAAQLEASDNPTVGTSHINLRRVFNPSSP
jgi:hypothetical protein